MVGIGGWNYCWADPKNQCNEWKFILLDSAEVWSEHCDNIEETFDWAVVRHTTNKIVLFHLADVLNDSHCVQKDTSYGFVNNSLFVQNLWVYEVIVKGKCQISERLSKTDPNFRPPMKLHFCSQNWWRKCSQKHHNRIQSFSVMENFEGKSEKDNHYYPWYGWQVMKLKVIRKFYSKLGQSQDITEKH